MNRQRAIVAAVVLGISGWMGGCSDDGDGGTAPDTVRPGDTVTTLDLVSGLWWTQVTVDTIIHVKDSAPEPLIRTETVRTTRSKVSVVAVQPGQSGGMDYVLRIIDTIQSETATTIDSGILVLNQEGGRVRSVITYGAAQLQDTLTYTWYAFPLTTGSSWTTANKTRDTAWNYAGFPIRFAIRGAGHGVGRCANVMSAYFFGDSLRPCLDLTIRDTLTAVLELDSTLFGYQRGYDVGTSVTHRVRTESFSSEFEIPLRRTEITVSEGRSYEFLGGVVQPGQTHDTTRTVTRVTSLCDPRWSPADTLRE